MIRNLKALGLALVAVFAFSAVVASAASAQTPGKLTISGALPEVTLTGTDTGPQGSNYLEIPGIGKTECTHSEYTGHKVITHQQTTEGVEHSFIPNNATEATITPHYDTHCWTTIPILGKRPTTVTMNGCDYVFTNGETTGTQTETKATYGATAHLKCPTGKVAEVHVYKSGSTTHPDADSICTVKFSEAKNQNLSGLHLTHTVGHGDFDIEGKVTTASYTREGSLCGSGEASNGILNVDVTVKGHNPDEQEVDVTITH